MLQFRSEAIVFTNFWTVTFVPLWAEQSVNVASPQKFHTAVTILKRNQIHRAPIQIKDNSTDC